MGAKHKSKLKIAAVIISVLVIQKLVYNMKHEQHSVDNSQVLKIQTLHKEDGHQEIQKPLMQLDLIVTFPILTDPNYKFHGLHKDDDSKKEARMKEYLTCLISNLQHRYVSHIHLLYDQPSFVNYTKSKINASLMKKLSFHRVNDSAKSVQIFEYIYSKLQGKLVMYLQADNYLGDGFDRIDLSWLKKNKLMFALTRWGQLEKECDMKKKREMNQCSLKQYRGSHDGYIFVPDGKLPKLAVQKLNVSSFHLGTDNLIVHVFKVILKYRVTNPCLAVKIYHLHCTELRHATRRNRVHPSIHKDKNCAVYPTDIVT